VGPVGQGATVVYRASVHADRDTRFSARVLPVIEDTTSRFLPGLIAWAA
jgi:hypothetical protein